MASEQSILQPLNAARLSIVLLGALASFICLMIILRQSSPDAPVRVRSIPVSVVDWEKLSVSQIQAIVDREIPPGCTKAQVQEWITGHKLKLDYFDRESAENSNYFEISIPATDTPRDIIFDFDRSGILKKASVGIPVF